MAVTRTWQLRVVAPVEFAKSFLDARDAEFSFVFPLLDLVKEGEKLAIKESSIQHTQGPVTFKKRSYEVAADLKTLLLEYYLV